MTRFMREFVEETREALNQLGLADCAVCGSRERNFSRFPIMLPIGGSPPDPEANVLFVIALTCEVCGNMTFFDSEKFRKSRPSLISGLTIEEEDGPGGGLPSSPQGPSH